MKKRKPVTDKEKLKRLRAALRAFLEADYSYGRHPPGIMDLYDGGIAALAYSRRSSK